MSKRDEALINELKNIESVQNSCPRIVCYKFVR